MIGQGLAGVTAPTWPALPESVRLRYYSLRGIAMQRNNLRPRLQLAQVVRP